MPEVDDFDADAWESSFREALKHDGRASRSWQILVAIGVSEDTLRSLLALACDFKQSPGYAVLAPFLKPGSRQVKAALDLADHLDASASRLRSHFGNKVDKALVEKLASTAAGVRASIKEAGERFSRKTLNPNFFLAWLLSELEQKSNRPHYRDVANLLEVAYQAHGQEVPDLGEEALRKMYRRFRSSNPLADLLSPEAKKNMVYVVLIAVVLAIISQAAANDRKALRD